MRYISIIIFLISILSVNAQVDKCGNSITDAGENCNNCPQDVACRENEACINNRCTVVKKESNLGLILLSIIIIGLATAITALIYILKKKKDYGLIGRKKEGSKAEIENFYKGAV